MGGDSLSPLRRRHPRRNSAPRERKSEHSNHSVPMREEVTPLRRFPEEFEGKHINHLPESISRYFRNAQIVLSAGVPSAAAVELRRTLEASAAHFGATGGALVKQIQKLIDDGLVTRQFGEAMTHVRKIGNVGAHATDEELSVRDIELASRFTEQLLRNLFEVPGELLGLREETAAEQAE